MRSDEKVWARECPGTPPRSPKVIRYLGNSGHAAEGGVGRRVVQRRQLNVGDGRLRRGQARRLGFVPGRIVEYSGNFVAFWGF